MNKKDLVIVALATFCLTSTLFMILPSRSTERDPWADTSGPIVGEPDGRINMRDIQYEIMHFNQDVSNMTRNVNVKESVFTWSSGVLYVTNSQTYFSPDFNTTGFREFTVRFSTNGTLHFQLHQTLVTPEGSSVVTDGDNRDVDGFSCTYEVKGTTFDFDIWTYGESTVELSCFVYMHSIPNQREYNVQTQRMNFSGGLAATVIECDGYSRLALGAAPAWPSRCSNGTYNVTLYAYGIWWSTMSWTWLSTNVLNVTAHVNNGTLTYAEEPVHFITETYGDQCFLSWAIAASNNLPSDWWIMIDVNAYLRNE